jgi:hypothetical protein
MKYYGCQTIALNILSLFFLLFWGAKKKKDLKELKVTEHYEI